MSILTSRFLMNLRRAASASTYKGDAQSPSYVRDDVDSAAAGCEKETLGASEVVVGSAEDEDSVLLRDADASVLLETDDACANEAMVENVAEPGANTDADSLGAADADSLGAADADAL